MQSDAVCWRYAGLLGFRFLDFDFKVGCRNFASTNDRARDFGVCDGGRVRGRLPATPCGQTLQGVSAAPRGYPLYAAGGQIISDPMISVFGGLSRGLDDRLIVAGPIARWALSPVGRRRPYPLPLGGLHVSLSRGPIRDLSLTRAFPGSRAILLLQAGASCPTAPLLHRRHGGVRKATGAYGA